MLIVFTIESYRLLRCIADATFLQQLEFVYKSDAFTLEACCQSVMLTKANTSL